MNTQALFIINQPLVGEKCRDKEELKSCLDLYRTILPITILVNRIKQSVEKLKIISNSYHVELVVPESDRGKSGPGSGN